MMEYDRSKDPMLAMDYARSSTPNYGDLHREIEALRQTCVDHGEIQRALVEQLTRYREVMEQAKAKMISYEATGYWNTDLVEKAITALREVLKEEK